MIVCPSLLCLDRAHNTHNGLVTEDRLNYGSHMEYRALILIHTALCLSLWKDVCDVML